MFSAAREYSWQMREYIESSGALPDVRGCIASSVGPKSEEVRGAYGDVPAEYGFGVRFASDQDQGSVLDAVWTVVEDTETQTVSDG